MLQGCMRAKRVHRVVLGWSMHRVKAEPEMLLLDFPIPRPYSKQFIQEWSVVWDHDTTVSLAAPENSHHRDRWWLSQPQYIIVYRRRVRYVLPFRGEARESCAYTIPEASSVTVPRTHFMKRVYDSAAYLTETTAFRTVRTGDDGVTRCIIVRPDYPTYRNEWLALWAVDGCTHTKVFYFYPFTNIGERRYHTVIDGRLTDYKTLRTLLSDLTGIATHAIYYPCFDRWGSQNNELFDIVTWMFPSRHFTWCHHESLEIFRTNFLFRNKYLFQNKYAISK
jgi:hypothetical protein